jgi:hypothetical protein
MTALELLDTLRARGVEVRAEDGFLKFRPRAAAADLVDEMRARKAELLDLVTPSAVVASPQPPRLDLVALTARYRVVTERLWDLAAEHAAVDLAELARLDQEQAKLCDDLGPLWAERCARPWFLAYARRYGRCPTCGDAGIYHDPDHDGEAVPLARAGDGDGLSSLRDTSGWLIALPGLGPRRAGPFAPCTQCARGTFATYGDRPLCRPCADAGGAR